MELTVITGELGFEGRSYHRGELISIDDGHPNLDTLIRTRQVLPGTDFPLPPTQVQEGEDEED